MQIKEVKFIPYDVTFPDNPIALWAAVASHKEASTILKYMGERLSGRITEVRARIIEYEAPLD